MIKSFLFDENFFDSLPCFRKYSIIQRTSNPSVKIDFVNKKLCEFTGYDKEFFISSDSDKFRFLVFKSDQKKYDGNIKQLCEKAQTLFLEYRLKNKKGQLFYVKEEATSVFTDSQAYIISTFSDITELKNQNENLLFLNKVLPCGIARFTYSEQAKITYLNEQMKAILKLPKDVETNTYIENSNLYFMIPPQDRRKFQLFLKQVFLNDKAIMGQMNVLRFDGSIARLHGWVAKIKNKNGQDEFQSVCVDITDTYNQQKENFTDKYIQALSEVYDRIFEYDFSKRTVTYLKGNGISSFSAVKNIPMQMQEAIENWINNTIPPQDQNRVKDFFQNVIKHKNSNQSQTLPLIKYTALSNEGKFKNYLGVFIKLDDDTSLFCCRNVTDKKFLLQDESSVNNFQDKANIQQVNSPFSDGIIAFEINNELVRPMYTSENICKFFGYSLEEWLSLSKNPKPLKEFVTHSNVAFQDFLNLIKNGEAEFTYFDQNLKSTNKVKAISSKLGSKENETQYIFLYNIYHKEKKLSKKNSVFIRTFGYFDVFIDDKPILFRNKKSKELLALLVDRKGGYITSEEAISFLWEDEPASTITLARYRKVALRLKNTLEEYNIANIIESVDGKRRLVLENVKCDLFDYLENQKENAHLFKGSYLTNFSWGETTLGELLAEKY